MLVPFMKLVTTLPPVTLMVGLPGAVGAVVSITKSAFDLSDSAEFRSGNVRIA